MLPVALSVTTAGAVVLVAVEIDILPEWRFPLFVRNAMGLAGILEKWVSSGVGCQWISKDSAFTTVSKHLLSSVAAVPASVSVLPYAVITKIYRLLGRWPTFFVPPLPLPVRISEKRVVILMLIRRRTSSTSVPEF